MFLHHMERNSGNIGGNRLIVLPSCFAFQAPKIGTIDVVRNLDIVLSHRASLKMGDKLFV